MGVGIVGVGHQLSGREETNEELCALLPDTTPEWIVEKTGITRRYLATEDETASGMAIAAARRALEMAGISGQDVGLVIACTFSADYAFPPVSAKIQHELGAKGAQIFDLQANCAGFVSGLTVASDRMRADPDVRYALVVGVELHTRFIDRTDVDTAIYFSDGAGAAVLGRDAHAHQAELAELGEQLGREMMLAVPLRRARSDPLARHLGDRVAEVEVLLGDGVELLRQR